METIHCTFTDLPGPRPGQVERIVHLNVFCKISNQDVVNACSVDDLEKTIAERGVTHVHFCLRTTGIPSKIVPVENARPKFRRYIKVIDQMADERAKLYGQK